MVPPREVWPMAFDKAVKEDALVAAARRCCVCTCFKGVLLEVHHIEPKSTGGGDDFDNAIPLCFDREGGVVANTAWRLPQPAEGMGPGSRGKALIRTDTAHGHGSLRVGRRSTRGPSGRESAGCTLSRLRNTLPDEPLGIHEANCNERVGGVARVGA